MNPAPGLSQGHTLTLLIAPPGWGKTSLILDLISRWEQIMIFISPLKALALEFNDRLVSEGVPTLRVESRQQLKQQLQRLHKYRMIILSYEQVGAELVEYLQHNTQKFFFIFDEFHLLFHWGSSFRPQLWEGFYRLAETGHSALALSATMDREILQEIKNSFHTCFQKIQIINQGNFKLLYFPQKIYRMRRQQELWIHLKSSLSKQKRCLVFLPFRQQVRQYAEELQSWGITVLTCVGGETLEFRQQLKQKSEVEVIVATQALGHGVNLPSVDQILIAYHVPEKSIWLQMVGRGGREGRPYSLYCMNTYGLDRLQNIQAWLRNVIAIACSWQTRASNPP